MRRFWEKVDKQPDGCWLWTGALANGYGKFRMGSMTDGTRRVAMAHRVAYELLIGSIPEGLDLDHLCRVRACVNPEHLEPVTRRENLLRGETLPAHQLAQTHCKNGHEFTADNITWEGTKRRCRTCRREYQRARRAS